MTTTTTTQSYDADLETATTQIAINLSRDGYRIDEQFEKSVQDALNNTWSEGLTVDEWVRAARAIVTRNA